MALCSRMQLFTAAKIRSALEGVNAHLAASEVTAELCLFGGAIMSLVFDARESTRDLDAIMIPKEPLIRAAKLVAFEMGLEEDWLNDGVKGFLSAKGEFTTEGLPSFSHLRLLRPTAQYLLAMKCLASRSSSEGHSGDGADILFLCQHLGLTTPEAVLSIVSEFYPDRLLTVKTKYLITELLAQE